MSLLASLFGCASKPGAAPVLLIQPLLDRLVPADFHGDAEFAERGEYLTVEIRARGLQKSAAGWTWEALEYRRDVSLPIFPGGAYKQHGWVKLSPPKEAK